MKEYENIMITMVTGRLFSTIQTVVAFVETLETLP